MNNWQNTMLGVCPPQPSCQTDRNGFVSGISHDTVSISPDMLFAEGSITKTFVAARALQLVEEGAPSLEEQLSKWPPAYPHVDGSITLRQLLNHTSGIYMF